VQILNNFRLPSGPVDKKKILWIKIGAAVAIGAIVFLSSRKPPAKPKPQLAPPAVPVRPVPVSQQLDREQNFVVGQQQVARTAQPQSAPVDPVMDSARQARMERAQKLEDLRIEAELSDPVEMTFRTPPAQDTSPNVPKPAGGDPPEKAKDLKDPNVAEPGEYNSANGKMHVIFEGAVVDAVLINKIQGEFEGPVLAMATNPIYSHSGKLVLIPEGTRFLGKSSKVTATGQARLAITFHRMLMPDGYSLSLVDEMALSQEGSSGVTGKVNNHYAMTFGAALAVGVLSGLAQADTGSYLTADGFDRVRAGMGQGLSQVGLQMMEKLLSRMPTITIPEGTRMKVYLSRDIKVPDYTSHTIGDDL